MARIGLGIEKDVKSKDGYDRSDRESYRQEPRESEEGAITAYDSAEAPDREGEGDEKEDGGCELGHSGMLSELLEHRIVKN
jgi:hypothetical protein